ncbi:hypothetical protein [Nibrella saemangeumensis]
MFVFRGDPLFSDYTKDLLYFLYIFIFLFLLINIPNDIIEVCIPVIIAFTLISNLALVYAMITDPTWALGQRAAITYGTDDERSGNPHVFARNALMCVIACSVWVFRPQTNFIGRIMALFAGVFSMAILVMTQTRSSIVALVLVVLAFIFFHARPAQIKSAVRGLFRPLPIITMGIVFIGIIFFFRRYYEIYGLLYSYIIAFVERNLENMYALLGLKVGSYKAEFDASAGNRAVSATFLNNVLIGHMHLLILGAGYKFLYLDIPVVEALINHGILGFFLFAGMNCIILYHAFRTIKSNPNPLATFLAYFYLLIFVQLFTNGRPYDTSFWHPLCLMIRFLGIDHLLPARLMNHPPLTAVEQPNGVVASNGLAS